MLSHPLRSVLSSTDAFAMGLHPTLIIPPRPMQFLPVYIVETGGSSNDVKGVVASLGAANMCGRVVLGLLVDAFPQRKAQFLVLCVGMTAAAVFGLGLTTSLAYMYVAAATIGGFGGSLVSLQPALIVDFVGLRALPLAQGLLCAVQAPSALFGSPLGGAVRYAWGSYQGTWLLAAAVHCVSTALAVCVAYGGIDCRRCCAWRRRQDVSTVGSSPAAGSAVVVSNPALDAPPDREAVEGEAAKMLARAA